MSQCLFTENSPQKLVAIEPAPATSTAASKSDVPTPKASSGHGKTIGIAVGVTVSVIVIAIIFAVILCFRRKRRPAATTVNSSRSHENLANSPQRSSAKELNAKENAIHELDGLDGPDGPRNVQTNTPRSVPPWVSEKGGYSGDRSEMVELTGDQAVPEPSQSEPLLGPAEMYGSPASPVELPGNGLGELPGSTITRNVSSAGSSSYNRRSRGFFQSRSSTPGFLPSPASGASPPNPIAGGPPASNRSATSSPPVNEIFSPISPIAEVENSKSQGKLSSLFRRRSQPGPLSTRAPEDRQASHGNV